MNSSLEIDDHGAFLFFVEPLDIGFGQTHYLLTAFYLVLVDGRIGRSLGWRFLPLAVSLS